MSKLPLRSAIALAVTALCTPAALADIEAAKRWIDKEFQPSVLSKEEQLKELEWFIKAAAPFKGLEVNVLSETIPTHEYEAKTLAKAFEEITGSRRGSTAATRPAPTTCCCAGRTSTSCTRSRATRIRRP